MPTFECRSQDDAEAEVQRVVTTGCIFAVFDAVLRLQALPAPMHLSEVMTGRAGESPMANKVLMFAVSTLDYGGEKSFAQAVQGSVLVSHPPLLTTRCRLLFGRAGAGRPAWKAAARDQSVSAVPRGSAATAG